MGRRIVGRYRTGRYDRTAVPDKRFVTVTYKGVLRYTPLQGSVNTQTSIVRVNDVFDPVYGVGNQYPNNWPYLKYGYSNCMVYASSIRAKFVNVLANSEQCWAGIIAPWNVATGSGYVLGAGDGYDTWAQVPAVKWRLLGLPNSNKGYATVSNWWSLKKMTGLNVGDWMTTTGYNANTSTDPSNIQYYTIFVSAMDTSTGMLQNETVVINYVVKYKVMLWGRINSKPWFTPIAQLAAAAEKKADDFEMEEEPKTPIDKAIVELNKLRNVKIK